MSLWNKLADSLATDPALRTLDEDAIRAVIDLLARMVYADEQATLLERATFRDQLGRLPWIADKKAFSEAALSGALDAARDGGQAAFEASVETAATVLVDPAARVTVFRMAATMAWVDRELHPSEIAQLKAMATAFSIADADTILAGFSPR